ncbi:MAG TPA: hypothetical protein VHK67_03960 [Rhabdochlamydiaceae bacterium]|nr:hypothetical protein [Rhabdochlamydiaceae bacterium]
MKKWFGYLILGVFGLMAGHLVYLYHHREFSPTAFQHPFILKLEGQTPTEAEKKRAAQILDQKFTYLGSGTQVTAFESADHQYVLKFFNPRNTIKENWFHRYSRLRQMSSWKWIKKTYFEKEARLLKFFKSHRLAFRDLKEESGLVYLHFDRSSGLSKKINVIDRDGKEYLVDLTLCPFILQKKVEIVMPRFQEQLAKGDTAGAKEGVRQMYQLFLTRAQKGYTDHRQSLFKNYGFAEGRAIQLDVGRIKMDERVKKMPLKDLERIVENLSKQLPPELAAVLKECLDESRSAL